VSIATGSIQWVDEYLVRRDASADITLLPGQRPRRLSEALLRQYEAHLTELLAEWTTAGNAPLAPFSAEEHFRLLPPCGALPVESIRFEDSFGGNATTDDAHIV